MKIAIFGTGNFGMIALQEYHDHDIVCFIDNNEAKQGGELEKIPIISLGDFIKDYSDVRVIVAVYQYRGITEQLRGSGLFDYEVFNPYLKKQVQKFREEIAGCKGKIALIGIDEDTEILLKVIESEGFPKDAVRLSDNKEIEDYYFTAEYECTDIDTAVRNGNICAVSSINRAYALLSYLEHEYPGRKFCSPYTLKEYGDSGSFIMNPYENEDHDITESEWIKNNDNEGIRIAIQSYMEELHRQDAMFDHIEIETYNRCNGVCSFCPVSTGNETRPEMKMDAELFYKIIDELSEMDYRGRLATFSNNEPFLDERILEFNSYARAKLPQARLHLFTNGTVLDLDTFIQMMGLLDEMVIDNYNQSMHLIPSVKKVYEYCLAHEELIKKVTIVTRKPFEIRTSRGGDAPNRNKSDYLSDMGCVLPFKQLIVRPDGKVSLCCNDPKGKYTMGDLKTQSLIEVWHGEEFRKARAAMLKGRGNYGDCRYCDTALLF